MLAQCSLPLCRLEFDEECVLQLNPVQPSGSLAPESSEPKKKALPPALAARLAKRGIIKVCSMLRCCNAKRRDSKALKLCRKYKDIMQSHATLGDA